MTFQEAAYQICKEFGRPLPPHEIANLAFGRGMVRSRAKDPTRSFIETIKKNIRGNVYNNPILYLIKKPGGDLIGA